MLNFLCRTLAVLVILLCVSTTYGQDTKVVVIPLGGDNIDQCEAKTKCEMGEMIMTCPSGNTVIQCESSKTVFVSSTLHNGDLGGLEGANEICQNLADTAGLQGEYRAWLSIGSTSNDPETMFIRTEEDYVNTNGVTVASGFANLGSTLSNPIAYDENGMLVSNFVWTNTNETGVRFYEGSNTCTQFTDDDESQISRAGRSDTTQAWSTHSIRFCDELSHLYCFEQ